MLKQNFLPEMSEWRGFIGHAACDFIIATVQYKADVWTNSLGSYPVEPDASHT